MTLDMIPLICVGGGSFPNFSKCLHAEIHAVLRVFDKSNLRNCLTVLNQAERSWKTILCLGVPVGPYPNTKAENLHRPTVMPVALAAACSNATKTLGGRPHASCPQVAAAKQLPENKTLAFLHVFLAREIVLIILGFAALNLFKRKEAGENLAAVYKTPRSLDDFITV